MHFIFKYDIILFPVWILRVDKLPECTYFRSLAQPHIWDGRATWLSLLRRTDCTQTIVSSFDSSADTSDLAFLDFPIFNVTEQNKTILRLARHKIDHGLVSVTDNLNGAFGCYLKQ